MAIPSLIGWRARTVTASLGGRSPAMGLVDDQVRAFQQAADREARNAAAYAIRKACRHWLAAPSGDPVVATAVRWLEGEAEAELAAHLKGWRQFAASKGGGRGALLKPLAPGYAHERRQYVAEGKARNPVSASALRDTALADAPHGTNAHQLISTMDEQTWDGYARPGGPMRIMGKVNEVLFFDKRERLEHMLEVDNGRLKWVQTGTLFETPRDSPFMYAMDGYGNLFARGDKLGHAQFNHSSFNAGREVVCAGMIGARDGFLQFISNESGHYQPSRSDLYGSVGRLRAAGVNFHVPPTQWRRAGQTPYAITRVRAIGVGDWPAESTAGVMGFDHIAVLGAAAPAPLPNPPVFTPWH